MIYCSSTAMYKIIKYEVVQKKNRQKEHHHFSIDRRAVCLYSMEHIQRTGENEYFKYQSKPP